MNGDGAAVANGGPRARRARFTPPVMSRFWELAAYFDALYLPDQLLAPVLRFATWLPEGCEFIDTVMAARDKGGEWPPCASILPESLRRSFWYDPERRHDPASSRRTPLGMIARLSAIAAQPWALREAGGTASIDADTLLVLLPFSDARAAWGVLDRGHCRDIAIMPGARRVEGMRARYQHLNEITLEETSEQARFIPRWYDTAREFSDSLFKEIAERALPGKERETLSCHRTMLANQFNLEFIRTVETCERLTRLINERRPRHVLLVSGDEPSLDLAKAVSAALGHGVEVSTLCGSPLLGRRLNYVLDRFPNEEPPFAATIRKRQGERLGEYLAHRRFRLHLPSTRGGVLVGVDCRDPQEFRYLPTAEALVGILIAQHRTTILQEHFWWSGAARKVRNFLARQFGPGVQVGFASALPSIRPPAADANWVGRTVDTAGELARKASGIPFAEAAAIAVMERFATRFMPQALVLAQAVMEATGSQPPALAVFIPDSQPFLMAAASGVRAAGVPTLAIQTLMIAGSGRDCRPVCASTAVIDSEQRALYHRRFGLPESVLPLVGHVEFDVWRKRMAASPPPNSGTKTLAFISQPLTGLVEPALAWTLEAMEKIPGARLIVYPHPSEPMTALDRYQRLIVESGCQEQAEISQQGLTPERIGEADAIITIVSNVGYRAAILGKRVLTIDPTGKGLPVQLDRLGLALGASGAEEVARALVELVSGATDTSLAMTREDFLARNPQMAPGGFAAGLRNILGGLLAGSAGQGMPR